MRDRQSQMTRRAKTFVDYGRRVQRPIMSMVQAELRETLRDLRLATDPSAARAHALLMRLLTPEQRQEYDASGIITLYSGTGATRRKFELRYIDLQVKVHDHEGRLFENWCGYVPNAPREDTLVAQLLAIRTDPARLRQAARVMSYSIPIPRQWRDIFQTDRPRRASRIALQDIAT